MLGSSLPKEDADVVVPIVELDVVSDVNWRALTPESWEEEEVT